MEMPLTILDAQVLSQIRLEIIMCCMVKGDLDEVMEELNEIRTGIY